MQATPTASSHHSCVSRTRTSPASAAIAEAREGRDLDRSWLGHPGTDQPQRAHPVGVGAAYPVGVVVGVVDPDLQGQADGQGEQGLDRREPAGPAGYPAAGQHRRDGGRQRPGARASCPLSRGGPARSGQVGAHQLSGPAIGSLVGVAWSTVSSATSRRRSILPLDVRGSVADDQQPTGQGVARGGRLRGRRADSPRRISLASGESRSGQAGTSERAGDSARRPPPRPPPGCPSPGRVRRPRPPRHLPGRPRCAPPVRRRPGRRSSHRRSPRRPAGRAPSAGRPRRPPGRG